jgi:hypothetical protein
MWQRARRADDGRPVAQVLQQLALDAADDVGGELGGACRITAVDGANDRERRDLHEVLMTLRRTADSTRELAGERQVRLDHASSFRLEPPPLRRHERMLRPRVEIAK